MRNLLLIFSLVFSFAVSGQNYYMSNSNVTSCAGTFESSGGFAQGGATASGYSFNENFTMTFCPGTGGGLVAMDFLTFVLGTGDLLSVYNGPSAASALLGVYDATNPLSGTISAILLSNPSGCLTFVFVSDSVGVGNGWNATVSCNIPCQPFEIGIDTLFPDTSLGGFIDVCDGDTAMLAVTGLYLNNGLNYNQYDSTTTFYWYNDSNLLDSGAIFNFPPDSSGAFLLQVYAVDTLGCAANFNYNFWVRVSTDPDFSACGLLNDTVCFGDTVSINYGASSTPWTNSDTMVSAPTTYLPDGSGSNPGVYNNTLTFSKFGAGDTIATSADVTKFWVDMEHSFLGDLSIKMTCPNGNSTIMKNFPGGGGRWLGEACDNNLTATPGIGYVYEWFPTGNSLTNMVAHSGTCVGCPTVSNPCNTVQSGTALQSSSYTTFQTMSNMIGCPLNGTWTLTIVDQWGIDNGFLFSWGVEFDSSMYPSTIISYDPGIDSIWLDTAAFATVTYTSADSIVVVPQIDSATYCYTVTVLDGFGCTYDTNLCFFVRDRCDPACYSPSGPNWVVHKVTCPGGTDGSLIASPNPMQIPFPWTYIWTDAAGVVLQTTVGSVVADSIGGLPQGVYYLEIIDGNGCSSNWFKVVSTIQSMQIAVPVIGQTSCYGSICDASATAVVFYGVTPYSYVWSSGDTNSIATSLCSGQNAVTITDANGCIDSNVFNVTSPAPIVAGATGSTLICVGNSTNISGNGSGGTPPYSYSWSGGFGVTQTISVSPIIDQTFTVVVSDANNCAPDSADVTVYVRPPLSITFDSPDTLCPGDTVTLLCYAHGGDSIYSYAWEQGLGNTAAVQTIVTTSQFYTVTITDVCGSNVAIDSVWLQIGGYAPLKVTTTPSDTLCIGDQLYLYAHASGGDGNYTYEWDNGLGLGQAHLVIPMQASAYTVTVVDECATPAGIATVYAEVGDFGEFNLWVDTNQNCDPGTFNFGFDTLNPTFNYEINFGYGYESVNPIMGIERVFEQDGCYDVSVNLTTKFGCETNKIYPCLFKVLPTPVANFDFNSHNPDILEHYVDFWDKSIGANTWSWFYLDSLLSTEEKFTHPFPVENIYNIKLVVSNEFGCLDSIDTDLPIAFVTTYYYPSAFTPNGNGTNEEFLIVGEGVMDKDYDLRIYDRWGGLVFKTASKNQGWNGRQFNTGDPLMTGIYRYTYTLKLHDGRKITDFGQVTLLK